MKISKIYAHEILDSRGNPTVEVTVTLESGVVASAAVPSGASTGTFEALELRDGDDSRYGGLGVLKAVENVNTLIAKELIGKDCFAQHEIDNIMLHLDGTENKAKLGANAILGVSLAVCRASAIEKKESLYKYIANLAGFPDKKLKLPVPMFNVLNGGKHSDSGLSVQEFKVVPIGIKNFKEQLRAGSEVFHALKKLLEKAGHSTGVGDEGGFSARLESNTQALEYINKAIENAGYRLGDQVALGIDVAANSFFDEKDNRYILKPEGVQLGRDQLINLYRDWISKYHVISVEDGLGEEDWEGWVILNEKIGKRQFLGGLRKKGFGQTLTIGDDLLVTNVKRLQKAIEMKACNSVLIKVNQIGSLSETLDCIRLAKKHGIRTVISHRSGETTDDFIADLAVGTQADCIKSGSLSRGERICKYNRLLTIEESL